MSQLGEVQKLQKQLDDLKKQYDSMMEPCRDWQAKADAVRKQMRDVRQQQKDLLKQYLGDDPT